MPRLDDSTRLCTEVNTSLDPNDSDLKKVVESSLKDSHSTCGSSVPDTIGVSSFSMAGHTHNGLTQSLCPSHIAITYANDERQSTRPGRWVERSILRDLNSCGSSVQTFLYHPSVYLHLS